MSVTTTWPCVYNTEVSRCVGTIRGVCASITAFIGRARRGPTNTPFTINSYADFDRIVGGLWQDCCLGYAVCDFYRKGGGQAIIVCLFRKNIAGAADRTAAMAPASGAAVAATGVTAADPARVVQTKEVSYTTGPAKATAQAAARRAIPANNASRIVPGLSLQALRPGAWGNGLRARVDQNVSGPDAPSRFNQYVRDGATWQVETFRNVSVIPGYPRRGDMVLSNESRLVTALLALPAARRAPTPNPNPARRQRHVWADSQADAVVAPPTLSAASAINSVVNPRSATPGIDAQFLMLFGMRHAGCVAGKIPKPSGAPGTRESSADRNRRKLSATDAAREIRRTAVSSPTSTQSGRGNALT